jgi:hypothetical protein
MIFINYSSIPAIVAVAQVNRLFATFLLRRLEFDPYEVHVGFMVDKVTPRFSPEPCGFPLANVIPQNHHIYSPFFRDIGNVASTGHSSTET